MTENNMEYNNKVSIDISHVRLYQSDIEAVEIYINRNGRLPSGKYPKDIKYFLVPDEEYNTSNFVIDESRHGRTLKSLEN